MKKIISLLLTAAFVLGVALSLTACGAPKDDGAEIKVYLGERVYDFDPTDYYVDSNAEQVMSLLYDPLFVVDEKGKLQLDGAADDYEIDVDNHKIIIELKETYWSDGVRVKAEDYVYAWRNILLDPTNANPAAALLYDIENSIDVKNGVCSIYELGAVASETYQITITYRNGANVEQLLKNLASIATSPIRQDIATDRTSGYWSKLVNTAITNGPFMISSVDNREGTFTLARNVGYHQELGLKNTTKIVRPYKLIGTASLSYSDIENNVVFYMSDAPLSERASNKDNAIVVDDLSTYTYVFNTDRPLFRIKEVRQALSMVIDRNAIISAITFGKAATGFIPDAASNLATGKSFNAGKASLISASAKKAEAQQLIASVYFEAEGLEKSFTLTINDDAESVAIADIVKSAWESLGFTVEIRKLSGVSKEVGVAPSINTIFDSELQVLINDAARGDFNGEDRGFDVVAVDWQMYSNDPFVALSVFADKYSGKCGCKLLRN